MLYSIYITYNKYLTTIVVVCALTITRVLFYWNAFSDSGSGARSSSEVSYHWCYVRIPLFRRRGEVGWQKLFADLKAMPSRTFRPARFRAGSLPFTPPGKTVTSVHSSTYLRCSARLKILDLNYFTLTMLGKVRKSLTIFSGLILQKVNIVMSESWLPSYASLEILKFV
jgi:hypothetical protein